MGFGNEIPGILQEGVGIGKVSVTLRCGQGATWNVTVHDGAV